MLLQFAPWLCGAFANLAIVLAAEKPGDDDQHALQGIWIVMYTENAGERADEGEAKLIARGARREIFKGNRVEMRIEGVKEPFVVGTYVLRSRSQPKQIDVFVADGEETRLGIYELQGDTLKMCFGPKGS